MGVIRMARPVRRKGSTVGQFRHRIPLDVIARVRGQKLNIPVGTETVEKRVSSSATEITLSLRCRDPAEATARQGQVLAYLGNVYAALRADAPIRLTIRQCAALAGEFYRGWLADIEREPVKIHKLNEDGTWTTEIVEGGLIDADFDADDIAAMFGAAADRMANDASPNEDANLKKRLVDFLRDRGIQADDGSLDMLAKEVRKALQQAFEVKQRNADGDFSPDPKADRFPPLSDLDTINGANNPTPRLTFDALLSEWKAHPEQIGISQSTVASYFKAVQKLKAFLKHNEVSSVTRSDIQRFAECRATEVSLKTVNDSDLASLKAVFVWAVRWDKHPGPNPAENVRLKQRKQPTVRADKGFTDAEAHSLLKYALNYTSKSGRENPRMTAAKRWVPWLMAYSGVRVGEVAQLRKNDVGEHEGHPAITISHEAGTTKTKATWTIPLHPHLIEQGFLDFVKSAPDGHLFLTPRPDRYKADAPESRTKDPRGILQPLRTLETRLQEFARLIVPRDTASPNHGWRHRFKTVGRAAGIETVVLDAFNDHAPRTESDKYGQSFAAMVKALEKMPRYEVK
jgi:integrase